MKFENSIECAKSELDLFSVPPTQTSIEEGVWDVIQPHLNFDTSPVIRFDIPGNNLHYIDMASTEIYVNCKIDPLFTDDAQTTVNNILHSMFEQVQVYLNNVPVENTNKTYPYRAYLENLLCYNSESKNTFLSTNGFFMDTANCFENLSKDTKKEKVKVKESTVNATDKSITWKEVEQNIDVDSPTGIKTNSGAEIRRSMFKKDDVMLSGKLHCDIFNVNRFLLNNVDVKLVLTKASPNFYLMGVDVSSHKIVI